LAEENALGDRVFLQTLRDQVSFKQHELYILDIRDRLCAHYRLNKSDLIKYLIKKEEYTLKNPNGIMRVE
jgi:hypothetical protein